MHHRFWMVLGPQGMPVVKHPTEDMARKEAERLARANSGQEFIVLQAVASCVRSDIRWEDCPPDGYAYADCRGDRDFQPF